MDLSGSTLFPVDYGNGRVDPSGPVSLLLLSLSPSLTASLCCIARLALCYHGNKDLCDMVRTMEGEKARNSRKGRVYLQSKTCSRNPEGIEEGRRRRDESSSPTYVLTQIFVLQHDSSFLSLYLRSPLLYLAFPNSLALRLQPISSSFVPFSPIHPFFPPFLLHPRK